MHLMRDARAFTPQEQGIVGRELEVRMRHGAPGRQKHQTPPRLAAIALEGGKIDVAGNLDMGEVVQTCAPQVSVGHIEPCRSNDIDAQAQTGCHPQNGTGILRNIGLVERKTQGEPVH